MPHCLHSSSQQQQKIDSTFDFVFIIIKKKKKNELIQQTRVACGMWPHSNRFGGYRPVNRRLFDSFFFRSFVRSERVGSLFSRRSIYRQCVKERNKSPPTNNKIDAKWFPAGEREGILLRVRLLSRWTTKRKNPTDFLSLYVCVCVHE